MKWLKRILLTLLLLLIVFITGTYLFLKSETFANIQEKIISAINSQSEWHIKVEQGRAKLSLKPTLFFGRVEASNPLVAINAEDMSVTLPVWAIIWQDYEKISLSAKTANIVLEQQKAPHKNIAETPSNTQGNNKVTKLAIPSLDVRHVTVKRGKDILVVNNLSVVHSKESILSGAIALKNKNVPFAVNANLKKYQGTAKINYEGEYNFNWNTDKSFSLFKIKELRGPNGLRGELSWEKEFLTFDLILKKLQINQGGGSDAPLPVFPVKGAGTMKIESIEIDKYKLINNTINFTLPDKASAHFNIDGGGDIDAKVIRAASFIDTDLSFKDVPLAILRTIDPKLNLTGITRGTFRGKASTNSNASILQSLAGSGSVSASNVNIPNFDVGYYLDFADSLVNKSPKPQSSNKDLMLDEITSTIRVSNGELFQDKILGSGDGYIIEGDGRYHFIQDRLNYRLNVSRSNEPNNPPLAIKISGSSKKPSFAPDTDAYAKYFLRREVEKQTDKVLEKLDEPVRDMIKDILKF